MQDRSGQVIYVGKAKKLRNRVSQYFVDASNHSPRTRRMVGLIHHFDVIVAASEFEALVLECSLIKRHMPKYNILLKDDKGYPYLRLDLREEYPVITMVNRVIDDGAEYYGPFGGRHVTQQLIDAIRLSFKLPGCTKKFPKDVGKNRPCLNYHMNNCDGWCQPGKSPEAYRQTMKQAAMVLQGKYKQVVQQLREDMEQAAEELEFERAAALRDRMLALENLSKKQLVTAGTMSQTDVVGYYQSDAKACFAVLHYVDGNLLDKEYEIVSVSDTVQEAVSALVKQFYLTRNYAPKEILLPCEMEDAELLEQLLYQNLKKKVRIRVPQRGDNVRLIELAEKNAREEAERVTTKEERTAGTLGMLQSLLGLSHIPKRIEAFDISNTAGTDIVASMVVFRSGKPLKRDYKRFKITGLPGQDDYASMHQILTRRFSRFLQQDASFAEAPDLLLIDGGAAHAKIALDAITTLGLSFPIYGMVKDNRHRTRALVTPQGEEIGIVQKPSVFSLIGQIQEEAHRFAISYHRSLQSKRLRESILDDIPGIGEVRKKALLKKFKSIAAIERAEISQLEQILPQKSAEAVYRYFRQSKEREHESNNWNG